MEAELTSSGNASLVRALISGDAGNKRSCRAIAADRCHASCPTCGAQYKVVRVEPNWYPQTSNWCAANAAGRSMAAMADFILEYFLVDRPRRRALARAARAG